MVQVMMIVSRDRRLRVVRALGQCVVFGALVVFASCRHGDAPDPSQAAGAAAPGAGAGGGRGGRGGSTVTPVEIEVARPTSIARTSLVAGVLEPIRTVGVTSVVGGMVQSLAAEEGTRVRAGQVLAELDSREISAQLRSAEAALTLAKAVADRSVALRDKRVVSEQEFERDQAALAAAEATVDQLRTRLGFTRITAPIAGVVLTQSVEAGDVISGQTTLFTIADVSTLVTLFSVSELEVLNLTPGLPVSLQVDALRGASVEARVRRIFPAADPNTRLVPVEVAVTGSAVTELRPGFTVRARLALEAPREVLTVSSRALAGAANARYLYVVQGGQAFRRTVQSGEDREGRTQIFDGIAAGDSVVIAGNALLRDGSPVRVVPPITADTSRSPGRP
jgi:membrane fusion protein (multidrug efflux system)